MITEIPGRYVICRTYSAGVFAGFIVERNGKEVVLQNSRRLWHWEGAASLSQLAMEGTTKPAACKFAVPVERVLLLETVEIIDVTNAAMLSIQGVREWRA